MKNQKKIKIFGLLGKNINYSFSKQFFEDKFKKEKLSFIYENFDIQEINNLKKIINKPNLFGLNVTIPYKESVLPYLDKIDPIALKIGAVNTILIKNNYLTGFNTDYIGFYKTIIKLISNDHKHALILGKGGASKAISFALDKLDIDYLYVSRKEKNISTINYSDLNEKIFSKYKIIINCTPLGTFPEIKKTPLIPTKYINSSHIVYDLIYNPTKTLLLKKSEINGAKICNGYKMLRVQAEEAWKIWNT